ncbi:transporter substrate-binding domain-containing protein [Cellulosilyticum sp. ST5]|uniref:transporter substrate-binding domain-containing protein n=1 Tax=unclassified Cellulosilyticum TaxID=2643091 RepID=UPI000F8ED92D|nr:transporter substrate-binding domain-containing protein [Cellulosilyticum sp. WCF-2]QEH68481.1 transporter substrate-binding domain-containing protein [Cellulosilyticum sp. WCF-2]
MKKGIKKIMATLLAVTMLGVLGGCTKTGTSEAGGSATGGIQKIKDAGVLKVGCKIDVPSFGLQNTATGEYEGVEIDLAYEIAGKIFDCTAAEAKEKKLVAFQGVTAKTRGGLLDSGEIDLVIATFTVTEERKESWNFSTPYYTDAVGLMVLKDSGIQSINDLDGKIIGVSQGSITKDGFEAYIKETGINVTPVFEEFDGYPALSTALSTKNIDVFAVDRAILAGYSDDSTMILEDRFAEQDYGVASALSNKELAETVDGVVKDLVDSGKMAEMLKAWGVE